MILSVVGNGDDLTASAKRLDATGEFRWAERFPGYVELGASGTMAVYETFIVGTVPREYRPLALENRPLPASGERRWAARLYWADTGEMGPLASAPAGLQMKDTHASKSQQLYWLLQIVGWGSFCAIHLVAMLTSLEISWTTAVVEAFILDGTGLALSHGLRSFVRSRHWDELSVPRMAWRIVVAAIIPGVPLGILTQLTHVAYVQNSVSELPETFPGLSHSAYVLIQVGLQITSCIVVFVIWLSLYFVMIGLREYRSSRLLQSEQSRALHLAELSLLKSQLKPHFLFNALNTVSSLIAENPTRAQSAVKLLANTLRHTLRSRPDELVPLAQEMSIVSDYLGLESMRFEDRLHVEIAIAADAAPVCIPVMVLQTLVENAIKHGIAELPCGGTLRIHARVESEELIVEVQNPRAKNPSPPGEGIGLRNARERLRLLFGDRASLDLDVSLPALATARLKVPCQP